MGEVYKARDTRLSRTVAIKVLPADASSDPAARARFEREARAIATLSHPHICVVHDVGHQDGIDYLVMELLEGETLAERIAKAKGPLPLSDVLSIGAAIADALDKAHRAGIVHRDLQPLNVMLTKSGPKLLDFGLAKLHGAATPVALSDETGATTVGPHTTKGTILGTIHYMSPEQVEGREADPRSDIWALGAVLYEMATGQRPFEGESAASVLGAIMQATPPAISTRRPLTPPSLERIVERCLAKSPDDRWQSVSDLRALLTWDVMPGGNATSQELGSAPSRSGRAGWLVAAVAALAAAVLVVPALRYARTAPPLAPPEARLDVLTPTTDDPLSFALSQDGRQIVFVASGDGVARLWLRSLASTTAQPIPGTEGATNPFWAPDGRAIAFVAANSLKRVDLAGSSVRTLATVMSLAGGSWSSKGILIIASSQGGSALMQISENGGTPSPVTTISARQSSHRWPWFLPDGNRFLYWAQGTPDVTGIYMGALDGRGAIRLFQAESSPVYLPSGWVLWGRGQSLMAQRVDIERGVTSGEPLVVADDVAMDARFGRAAVSASAGGLVAYRAGHASLRQLTWFDRSGAALGTAGDADSSGLETPRLSPDGHRLAVGRSAQNNQDIWLLDAARPRRITFDPGIDRFPVWSPDGQRLAFMSNRGGNLDLYTKLASGAGTDEVLVGSDRVKVPTSWSSDGRYLLYHSVERDTAADLWVLPIGDRTPRVLLKTPFREAWGAFSPDGRWVAYQSNESGRAEIYVRAFVAPQTATSSTVAVPVTPGGGQWQVSTDGGVFPVWRADGRELFFLDLSGAMMSASVDASGSALNPGEPVRLFQARIVGAAVGNQVDRQFDVAPDGRFLIDVEQAVAAPPITLIQNWDPEATR